MFNSGLKPMPFRVCEPSELPAGARQGSKKRWFRAIDTGLTSPEDVSESGSEPLLTTNTYPVREKSMVILISKSV
jgi:hypothetical protein